MITEALAVLTFIKKHWRAAALGALTGLVLLAILFAYVKGRMDGKALAADAAKQELIEQLNERGTIDGVIEQMDGAGLCRALGRMWNNGQCE
ncbi:hypothetical protein GOZ78_03430 [Agrobacterium vitis]|uniref:hypothetical protein n=1 Tax=Agrobacterium vitis TaxID=373 RepID=UPI0012E8C834|nr:hypothetical protein [Agrobacterium vitis]MUZ80797.1 hypothetical protein [Agrobacterium vitis]MVA09070.1 hypothetical protein [Agrobacterium vitis]